MPPYDWQAEPLREAPVDLVARIGAYSVRAERLAALLDEDPVVAWRRSRFLAIGCDSLLAQLLADSPQVEPSSFEVLVVGAGCPFDVAARILL